MRVGVLLKESARPAFVPGGRSRVRGRPSTVNLNLSARRGVCKKCHANRTAQFSPLTSDFVMKFSLFRLPALALLLAFVATALTGCDLAQGIFKAGFFSAFIIMLLVGLGILFLIRRMRS